MKKLLLSGLIGFGIMVGCFLPPILHFVTGPLGPLIGGFAGGMKAKADGYIRYFTGEYETFHRAKQDLPAVQAKGYKDAYVVCIHDGKLLSGDEAIMKIYGEGDE